MYEFKEEYVTGIASVDTEHKRLFEIADEAYQLTKEEFLVDKYDQVRHILGELKEYALQHFEHEEAYMESINYKHMFIQKVQHDQFREKINDMNLEHLDENTDSMLEEILEYLTNWLINHILEHDKQIGM
ncbi:MAG: bacteriohemerythrin [Lachnospiraceae bacterium]|nr:bacteriohemerythrin [Lachnospiraceae bacterium]MBQ8877370.1 bacteriohemerythrin [Lachnospiraceae bacterium]